MRRPLTFNVFFRYSLLLSSTIFSSKSSVRFNALGPITSIFSFTSCTNGITLFIYFFNSVLPPNSIASTLLFGNSFSFFCNVHKEINARAKNNYYVRELLLRETYEIHFPHRSKNNTLPARVSLGYPNNSLHRLLYIRNVTPFL